jgi:hypothetical protein
MHEAVVSSVLLCSVKNLAHNKWVIGTFGTLYYNSSEYIFTDQDGDTHTWVFAYAVESVACSIAIGFALRPFVVECEDNTEDTIAINGSEFAQCLQAANPSVGVSKQCETGLFSINTSLGAPNAWITLNLKRVTFYKNGVETLSGEYPNNYNFLSFTSEIPIAFIVYVCDFVVAASYCDKYDSGVTGAFVDSYGIESLAAYHAECKHVRRATPKQTHHQGWLM